METYKLANRIDFIEGATEARHLIYTLSDEITSASIPTEDGLTVPSKWEEIFRAEGSLFVEYNLAPLSNTVGRYKHTNGTEYDVMRVKLSGHGATYGTNAEYKFKEVDKASTYGSLGNPSGYEIDYNPVIAYTDLNGVAKTKYLYTDNVSFVIVPDPENLTYGYSMIILEQGYKVKNELDEEIFVEDLGWGQFHEVAVVSDLDILKFGQSSYSLRIYSYRYDSNSWNEYFIEPSEVFTSYRYSKINYTAKPIKQIPGLAVLKATPDVPVGITPRDYFVMLKQYPGEYNYIDVSYGVGFQLLGEPVGNPADSYLGICDPATVDKLGDIPTIIDQLACHLYYQKSLGAEPIFKSPEYTWEMDVTGTKEMKSPEAHFFYGRDSTTQWVINKDRRPDYLVRYWLSINNNRVALVIEGDPAPSIADYYRSFGYIGKITPFNQYDHAGNFGVTVGMGHLTQSLTGFVEADIKENTAEYGWWGEYTSNGMWSMSMFNTRSNVFFQSHHPAFLTQLPNYNAGGTIPAPLKRLILDDDRFQPSIWTSKYHGSPIYMVHRSEGYRGFMDGVVVVEDHNIVNGDELVVDTHILKDSSDPSKGTWIEVYKFFSVNTPVNLFSKYSPAPGKVSVAILKEIK